MGEQRYYSLICQYSVPKWQYSIKCDIYTIQGPVIIYAFSKGGENHVAVKYNKGRGHVKKKNGGDQ